MNGTNGLGNSQLYPMGAPILLLIQLIPLAMVAVGLMGLFSPPSQYPPQGYYTGV
jgi:hypothetical protein